jgi:hypothetical protein
MFMCPLSPAGATVRPRLSWRPGGQPPSEWGGGPALGRRVEAEQPPKTAAPKCTAPEPAGSKRAAPKLGLSDRPVKKAWVRSKM